MNISTTTTTPVNGRPVGNEFAADPPAVAGSETDTGALLPEPAACGLCDGSMAQLAMLLTRADQQDRTTSRQIETAADQAATQQENQRVAEMRARAQADESQALASGIGDIAGGACMVGGGFFAPASSSNPSGHGFDWNAALNGGGKALPGAGQMIGGVFKGDADRAEADAARSEAQAQADLRRSSQAHEDTQAANQSIQRVEQFLDQVQQTQNATRLTAATFRG
jgi:hypothetical protein